MSRTMLSLPAVAALMAMMVSGAAQAQQRDREITLINHAHAPVLTVYVASSGSDTWQGNLLSSAGLRPNHAVDVGVKRTGPCRFDLKTVFADGSSLIRRNVDACSVAIYTVTD
jgi:hypothetical protein